MADLSTLPLSLAQRVGGMMCQREGAIEHPLLFSSNPIINNGIVATGAEKFSLDLGP